MKRSLIALSISISLLALAGASENGHKKHHPEMTADQKSCLSKILGEPGSVDRPSRDKMEAAFKSCGIEAPKGPPAGDKPEDRPAPTGEVSE